MTNWPQKNKFEESKQHKDTPGSRIASLEHIAILHKDPFYMEGGNFYLVHKLVFKKHSSYKKINSNLFSFPDEDN